MCYGTMKSFAHCATRAYIVIHLHVCIHTLPSTCQQRIAEWKWSEIGEAQYFMRVGGKIHYYAKNELHMYEL